VGAGVPANAITDVYCVTKAYSSCVGAGPFVTELFGDEAVELRNRGGDAGEYGATTGRPRRVGWFDAVATRYGCMVQGATECVLTNLDVLGYLDEIPVCTGYEVGGKVITEFPNTPTLIQCKPVYTYMPGWKTNVRGVTSFAELPENCQRYVDFLQTQVEVPIRMLSTGPKRCETFRRS
jgi:adenylosuccinate synthase